MSDWWNFVVGTVSAFALGVFLTLAFSGCAIGSTCIKVNTRWIDVDGGLCIDHPEKAPADVSE